MVEMQKSKENEKDLYEEFKFYLCPEETCEDRNNSKEDFVKHVLEKHPATKNKILKLTEEDIRVIELANASKICNGITFQCEICNHKFSTRFLVRKHLFLDHKLQENTNKHIIEIISELTNKTENISDHLELWIKQDLDEYTCYVCPECDDILFDKLSLVEHAFGYHPTITTLHEKFMDIFRAKHLTHTDIKPVMENPTSIIHDATKPSIEERKSTELGSSADSPSPNDFSFDSDSSKTDIKEEMKIESEEQLDTNNENYKAQKNFKPIPEMLGQEKTKDLESKIFVETDLKVDDTQLKPQNDETMEDNDTEQTEQKSGTDSGEDKDFEKYSNNEARPKVRRCFKCKFCDASYKNLFHLKTHNMIKHGLYTCYMTKICETTFEMFKDLKHHWKNSHKLSSSEMVDQEKLYNTTCDICKKTFLKKKRYIEHSKTHDNPSKNNFCQSEEIEEKNEQSPSINQCDICRKQFPTLNGCQGHKGPFNSKVQNPKCDACGLFFPNMSLLDDHMKKIHIKLKQNQVKLIQNTTKSKLKCTFCPRIFSKIQYLRTHLRCHVKEPQKFICVDRDCKFLKFKQQ